MINLLPPDIKATHIYARRNNLLIRYMLGICIGIACVIAVIVGSWLYLQREINSHEQSVAASEKVLKQDKESETIARANAMSDSLKLVVQVLSQEVRFSALIQQIGSVMPHGTVLQDLNLDASLTGGIDLEVGAASHDAGVQAQTNLQDPQYSIFDKVDIVNSICRADGDQRYPCTVSLRARFAKDNTFMLIQPKDDKS